MTTSRPPRRRPEAPTFAPTTLTEITRRYVATALALSKAMGLPMTETFIKEHRESISCCFIEAGRAGVRLSAGVTLPPLSAPAATTTTNGQAPEPEAVPPTNGQPEAGEFSSNAENNSTNGHALPTTIPADGDLPCAGQEIALLKPAQLAMLISKVAALMHGKARDQWVPLLAALQRERQARLERGQRPKAEANGDGA
jgi:hypothetical protein